MSALTVFDVFVKIVTAILQHTEIIICIIIYLMFNLFVKMFSDDLLFGSLSVFRGLSVLTV